MVILLIFSVSDWKFLISCFNAQQRNPYNLENNQCLRFYFSLFFWNRPKIDIKSSIETFHQLNTTVLFKVKTIFIPSCSSLVNVKYKIWDTSENRIRHNQKRMARIVEKILAIKFTTSPYLCSFVNSNSMNLYTRHLLHSQIGSILCPSSHQVKIFERFFLFEHWTGLNIFFFFFSNKNIVNFFKVFGPRNKPFVWYWERR